MKKEKEIKKVNKNKKNASKNNKGFTLIEIIAVVIIIGIVIVVSGISVTSYIENSRAKTYESYKEDLKGASKNYFIDCMTNNGEGCNVPVPQYGNSERISYNELVEKGYTKKLKDPEGNGYCNNSYVIATNKSENGVDIEYQVCLFCSNYKSTEAGCKEVTSDDVTPPTCGPAKGESTEWSKENKVITVGCSDSGIGCKKNEFSSSIGKEGEVTKEGVVTIEDKAGNKTNCPVTAYVDRKAPTCKIEIDETSVNGWYKTGVTAKITDISDEGSGVAASGMGTSLVNRSYNGNTSYVVTGGIVTVFGYVKDNVGNEGYCSKEVKVDNTDPSGTIYMGYEVYPKENSSKNENTLTINNLNKYGEIEGIIVYFSESLTSSIESSVYDSSSQSIKESGGLTSGNNYGVLKVTPGTYDMLKINVSNRTYADKITKVEVIKNESETSIWTNKDVTVYVEGKDTITGVGKYSFDNGFTYKVSNQNTYTENTSNYVVIKDKVGNISEKYEFVINKIDKIEPSCELEVSSGTLGSNGWYKSNIEISFTTHSDTGGSGVSSYGIGGYTSSKTTTISSDTKGATYTGYISDIAGNTNTCQITIKRDATNPTCGTIKLSGTSGSNGWYKSDVTITKTDGSDGTSDHESTVINKTSVIGETKGTTVTLTTTDKAGNVCTTSTVVKIDKTKPACGTINLSGTSGWNGWYIGNVTITKKDGSDSLSGVSNKISHSSITTNTSGTTVTLTTTDEAGNVCTTTKTIKIDKTTPTVSHTGTCTGGKKCNSFSVSDTSAQTLYLIRSHCAEPKEGQTDEVNYCVTGYHASERLDYFYANVKGDLAKGFDQLKNASHYAKTKDSKSIINKFDNSGYGAFSSTINLSTTYRSDYLIEYSMIVCDQAGNCSARVDYKK